VGRLLGEEVPAETAFSSFTAALVSGKFIADEAAGLTSNFARKAPPPSLSLSHLPEDKFPSSGFRHAPYVGAFHHSSAIV